MNNYLIPANSKKSMLIFGLFNKFDLILFSTGLVVTLILLVVLKLESIGVAILALLPGVICGFLVMPVPNYHNIRTIIKSAIDFFTTKRKFIWKGWCFPHGEETKK